MRSRSLIAIALVVGMSWCGSLGGVEPEFRRGDVGNEGTVTIADAITLLGYLFQGQTIECRDAGDIDDNGTLTIADPIQLLSYLFNSGATPPAPGPLTCGPDPTLDTIECLEPPCGGPDPVRLEAGHLLARASFGARTGDVETVIAGGIPAWVDAQIFGIDESTNTELNSRVDTLSVTFDRTLDTEILKEHTLFRFQKGNAPYPLDWQSPTFDDSAWPASGSPFRFSFNGTGGTQLLDMQGGYTSIAIRGRFQVANPASIPALALRCDFDDGFVAWLNGVEIARRNVTPTVPTNTSVASANHGAGIAEYFSIPTSLLVVGENVLAVQGMNRALGNGDFYLEPRIVIQAPTADPPRSMMRNKDALQRFAFFQGTYSENSLGSVLALFWDNHFTTDFDKVKDYIQSKRDRYNRPTIFSTQAQLEAAEVEREEFQFFIDNAFENFGDLLLYSASSPSMLIYLDSVLNDAAEPNENYAREILELFGLGVDNGYTQADVEEVARCFTGWSVEKVPYASVLPYPERVTTPLITTPTDTIDADWIAVGDSWNYFKGTTEPSPGAGGVPTTLWADVGFDDTTWFAGPTGIGFGDGDDATVLGDMQGNYKSIYLRNSFTVTDVNAPGTIEAEIFYDDGVVLYLNGVEITRSNTLANAGSPPGFIAPCGGHEVTNAPIRISLDPYRELLNVGENVLAIHAHNSAIGGNDLSCIPRLFLWQPGPGYLDPEDRQGHWQFRFNPANHDTGPKTIFAGTPYELQIPDGRLGVDGVQDGIDVIDRLAEHPSTAEFIGVKLIGLLVSDEIDLPSAHDLSAPIELRALLASVIATWNSTTPPGNIEQVVRTILSANDPAGAFWGDLARRAKVKTPFEHMVSTMRALEVSIDGRNLPSRMSSMGQHFFDRDEPDGWPERGDRWIGTTSLLERVNFIREVAENSSNAYTWQPLPFIQAAGAVSASEIIDLFDELLFQGTLNGAERLLLLRFAEVQPNGSILPFDPAAGDYEARVELLVGMIMSMPRWCFQ